MYLEVVLENAAGGAKGSLVTIYAVPDVQLWFFLHPEKQERRTNMEYLSISHKLLILLVICIQNLRVFWMSGGC